MPLYKFTCKRGHVTEKFRHVAAYVEWVRCLHETVMESGPTQSRCFFPCGMRATITIDTSIQVSAFRPYTEEHLTGKPIKIETREQRDVLCKQHGVSYDSNKYHSKPKVKAAVEDVTYGDVKAAMETGRLPDGSKLEQP